MLDLALRNPLVSEPDSCFGDQNDPLGESRYQVPLRFYKGLGDLGGPKHLHLVKNIKSPKV